MSRVVDFDAIRAEITPDEPIEVRSGDTTILVRGEMPWEAAVAWDKGNLDDAVELLVIDAADADRLRGLLFGDHCSRATALKRLIAIWDVEPGESGAS